MKKNNQIATDIRLHRAELLRFFRNALSGICLLAGVALLAPPALGQVVNSTWLSDGSGNFSNGNWGNAALWNPDTVPNNAGPTLYDVTIPYYPGHEQFNGPQLDVNVTVRNLTLVNRVFIDNQANVGNNLTVTGSTTLATEPGHDGEYAAMFSSGGTYFLGTLTNYDAGTHTLDGPFFFPFNGATIGFRGADIITNRAALIIGAGSRIIDQNTNANALRNIAVNEGLLSLGDGYTLTTSGNFTNNGSLTVSTGNGLTSMFTISGSLTNFDAPTHTLTNGFYNVEVTNVPGTATLRFPNADIRTLIAAYITLKGAGASIQDLAGQNALRNLSELQGGSLTSAGTMTITPTGGTFTNNGASHVIDTGAHITIQGNHNIILGGTLTIGAPANNSDTSFRVNGTALINQGSIDMGGQPGVNTQYHSTLQVINGIEYRGAFLTGTGTTFADIQFTQGTRVQPGHSPGQLTFQGAVGFDNSTTVEMQIGGLMPGVDFDQIVHLSPGIMTLGGTLDLSLINGFENSIQHSDTFPIVVSNNNLAGAFDNVLSGGRLYTSDGFGSFQVNYSGTAVSLSQFQPTLLLTAAVSRKTHGARGPFDINLPLTGTPGVECRASGGNHTLVFTFANDVVSGDAQLASGTAVVGSPTFAANTMTVNLSSVADVQTIRVTLSSVTDGFGQVLPDVDVSVGMLVGDTSGNNMVNSSDVAQTKAQAGAMVTAANFRDDVNASGTITASDIAQVKANAGHFLP